MTHTDFLEVEGQDLTHTAVVGEGALVRNLEVGVPHILQEAHRNHQGVRYLGAGHRNQLGERYPGVGLHNQLVDRLGVADHNQRTEGRSLGLGNQTADPKNDQSFKIEIVQTGKNDRFLTDLWRWLGGITSSGWAIARCLPRIAWSLWCIAWSGSWVALWSGRISRILWSTLKKIYIKFQS